MGRTPCCEKDGLKKGPWTTEEDQKLIDYIQKHGPGNWRILPKKAGLERCGKSCRLRWTNYLRPDIKRGRFSFEEEETIIQLHSILGNKWSAIAAKLPGRTDNEIKNYWNTHIRKRLLRMGIDPVTHGPRLDLLDLSSILNSLQTTSLINMPALVSLQNLLNPEILRLATSLASAQNSMQNSLPQNVAGINSDVVSILMQNLSNPNPQIGDQIRLPVGSVPYLEQSSSDSCFRVGHSGLEVSGRFSNTQQSFDCSAPNPVTLYPSSNNSIVSNNSNQSFSSSSSLSSVLSTPCSSPGDLIDSGLANLLRSTSSEDEIENYFSNMVKKFESRTALDVHSR